MLSPTVKDLANQEMGWLDEFDPDKCLLRGASYQIAKRCLDLLLVLLVFPLLVPLLLLCALAIKLEDSSAPIFFVQIRAGKGGKPFRMYKFRTMVPNAPELKEQLAPLSEMKWPDFKLTDDPRITPVGRVLRKTSLDEIPQLFNVLLGEMSLVGPRPTSFLPDSYLLWQTERLDVMPGVTGVWQLIGRGSTEFDDRARLDIAYVENRCLWLDIQILIRTIPVVLQQRGAR